MIEYIKWFMDTGQGPLTGERLIIRYIKDFMRYGYGPRQAKQYAMKLSVIRSKRRPPK